jgi:hypothetical protein
MASVAPPWAHWPVVLLMEAEALWRVLRLVAPVVLLLALQPIRAPAATALIKTATANVIGLLAVNNFKRKRIANRPDFRPVLFR